MLFSLFCFAEDRYTYININSNVEGADIFIDGIEVGKTPLYSYKVFGGTSINITAKANKKYYPKDINKSVFIEKESMPTIYLEFQRGEGVITFKGPNGHLYINKKFITTLDKYNRAVKYKAADNIKIEIINKDKRYNGTANIYANESIDITYELKEINLDENLYTLKNNELMWQDDKDSGSKTLKFEDAKIYCDELELAGYFDWELPSIEQLKSLYKIKEEIYNGIGGKAYWSSQEDLNSSQIWKYTDTLNFENGKVERKVQSFFDGSIRCVRIVN